MEEWTVSTLKEHLDAVLDERDRGIRDILATSTAAIGRIEERVNLIVTDHVGRVEFNELKAAQQQSKGARNALIAVLGVVITLIAVALGAMYDQQLTHKDISEQIEHESPYASDKPDLEKRLRLLEQAVILLQQKTAVSKPFP